MSENYTIDDVKSYMHHRLEKASTEGLFEFDSQQNCRKGLDKLGIDHDSGKGLLYTFSYIAGGWETEVGRRLLDEGPESIGISDRFDDILSADLSLIDDAGYGGHPHRHANGAYPSEAIESLATVGLNEYAVESMEELFRILAQNEKHDGTAFDEAFSLFKNIDTFGGLTAFDYIDFAVRVNGQEFLTPEKLKVSYVNRNGPKETLERMLDTRGIEFTDLSDSSDVKRILSELTQFAEEELNLSHEDAVFDVESCLCTYYGDLEDKGPDWRGSCS